MITEASTPKAWAKALARPATEFSPTQLPILAGEIPPGLRGTLYRNGPGRLERRGERVGHWFDGDGAILAVHFTDAGATGIYRYVQTAGYQAETAAGKFLYPNYGMTVPGPFWKSWGKLPKNAANTSVLALPDKLLALWEAGNPHALDLQTLATKGLDDLSQPKDNLPYSAHPKVDAPTGDIFNFGIKMGGLNATLHVYKSDRTGKIVQKTEITLDGIPFIHDFVMAGQYLVFLIPPLRFNLLPIAIGLSSLSDAGEWKPSQGTEILVLDRASLSVVSRGKTEAWFQWHFSNGYVDADGKIVVDFVRHQDFNSTNREFKQVPTGKTQTGSKGTLWRSRLDPQTGKVTQLQQLLDRGCEFPVVSPQDVGVNYRYLYLSVYRDGVDISQELYGAIARFDLETDNLTVADLGENRYPTEPIYVPDARKTDRGWVLTVVYDGGVDRSEVWVYDSERMDDEPVCKLELPRVVPIGFHGTWKATG